jgi:nucleotide-binding universal stress UspA family protein
MHILIPFNYDNSSEGALRYGIELAEVLGGQIHLLHAEEPVEVTVGGSDNGQLQERGIQNFLQEYLGIETRFDLNIIHDFPEEGIAAYATQHQIDLVVMGTDGIHDRGEYPFGSVAAGVVSNTQVPVLIVPEGIDFQPLRQLVCASDFKDYDYDMLYWLESLAQKLNTNVDILHVRPEGYFEEEGQFEHFQKTFAQLLSNERFAFHMLYGENYLERIRDWIEEHDPNWLIMRHRHTDNQAESFCRNMLWHASLPLLIIPEKL